MDLMESISHTPLLALLPSLRLGGSYQPYPPGHTSPTDEYDHRRHSYRAVYWVLDLMDPREGSIKGTWVSERGFTSTLPGLIRSGWSIALLNLVNSPRLPFVVHGCLPEVNSSPLAAPVRSA